MIKTWSKCSLLPPMALADVVQWLASTEPLLRHGTTIAGVQQRPEYLGAAFADYDGPERMGRICGWVNGLFDFKVIRHKDGKQVFFRHVEVEEIDDPALREAIAAFVTAVAEMAAE